MAGFIRRFNYNPGADVIQQIEGVNIIDLPPPGSIEGVGTGTVCIVGEFADMTYATLVDANGNVTTNTVPTEVFSSQDLINKFGGFDETMGQYGGADGSGFVALRNKKFARLVVAAVNLCSAKAVRVWRELPTNKSATDPTPILPVSGGTVTAGREFKSSSNRMRLGAKVSFAGLEAYVTGTDGVTTAAAPNSTNTFNSPGANFITSGVKEGDALVVGVIGGAGALGANANTYRVTIVTDANNLVVELLRGADTGNTFAWTTGSAQPWRIHDGSTVASAGYDHQSVEAGAYQVPARPLDATIAASTVVLPTIAPPTGTANVWDPLTGLAASTFSGGALTYTSTIQAPNAPNDSTIDVLYSTALDSLLQDAEPASDINIVFSARHSSTIRNKLRTHVDDASSRGLGRMAINSPQISQRTLSNVLGNSDPGVGANRDERLQYSWPGCTTLIPEAVGSKLATGDSKTTLDGVLDQTFDSWMACILSNLAPERNPGQIAEPVPTLLAPILGFQRGMPALGMPEYIALRRQGVAALRKNSLGFFVQSGITTSQVSGQKNVNRRRMADYIEDSVAKAILPFDKLPLSTQVRDGAVGEIVAFLNQLQSPTNPASQRIEAYSVDDKSGNTPELLAAGVFVINISVRMLATADFITLQFNIGPGVTIENS